jgi:hypothetical protein
VNVCKKCDILLSRVQTWRCEKRVRKNISSENEIRSTLVVVLLCVYFQGKLAESFGDLMGIMWPELKAQGEAAAAAEAASADSGDGGGGGGGGDGFSAAASAIAAALSPEAAAAAAEAAPKVSGVAPRGFKYHMGRFRPEFQVCP